ncbi:autotransporter-associated beta strand repeat-containing protein [Roseibacillus persicicus]|uniref:autotransporter-associated beta strand repeat-containing protein n=1 Tax=Roseibacillus persicicus TaxID=454148 RepID=UPI00167B34C8|nr:autotransporter-associated beta strand repeat-containing protein [Roseibacillus persicicus]
MNYKHILRTTAVIAVATTAAQAAEYVKGYNRGSGSQLLLANGGAGATTFVDEAAIGDGDMNADAGNPTWGWEINGGWQLDDRIEFTGIALPIWANQPDTDATNNTQNATHRIRFYSCGENDTFDGADNETLLGTVDVSFTSADAGVDEYYVNFDAPLVWEAADSFRFYFYIQAIEEPDTPRALRIKTGAANAAALIRNRVDGSTMTVGGSTTTRLTVAGSVNRTVWHGDGGTDGIADWDSVSSNWNAGSASFTDGEAVLFDEVFDGDSSRVNLVGDLSPAVVSVANTSGGLVPTYEFVGSGRLTGAGGLARSGDGTLTISNTGINDYTGGTGIGEGTIKLGITDGLSTASSLTIGGSTGIASFALNGFDQAVAGLNSSGSNLAEVVNGSATPATLTVSNGGAFSGRIGDPSLDSTDDFNNLSVVKTGAGTLNMVGSFNNYSGTTTVTGGTYMISDDLGLGAPPAEATADAIVLDGGTLRAHLASGTGGSFAINANRLITLGNGGGTIQTTTPSGAWSVTYNGVISGPGSLTKTSAQTLVLGGANTYTGPTTVSAGFLRVNGSLVSEVTVQSSGYFSAGLGSVGGASIGGLTLESNGRLQYYFDSLDLTGAITTVTGSVTIGSGALLLTVDAASTAVERPLGEKLTIIDYSGGSLTGTFEGLPEGGTLDVGPNTFAISYNDDSKVTLTTVISNPYEAWATANITGGAAAGFEDDADSDGLENGLEFILGGDPMVADPAVLPTFVLDEANLTIAYNRVAESIGSTTQFVEWSVDLEEWTSIEVTGTETSVSIAIPASNAVNGKLFGRIRATNP